MKITLCACASRSFIDKAQVAKLAAMAQCAGIDVEIVEDLCEICEDHPEQVKAIAQTTIVACHSRAIENLMDWVGEKNEQALDLRSHSAEELMRILTERSGCEVPTDEASVSKMAEEEARILAEVKAYPKKVGDDAWYPTLDKKACAECGKCFAFCPFGVYEKVEDKVRVMNPHRCKNNCPSCARFCPASAIVFPKYDKSPINGGDLQEEITARNGNAQELFNEALRKKLAARRQSIIKS